MLPKPPLGIFDQPHIGITLLEVDQMRQAEPIAPPSDTDIVIEQLNFVIDQLNGLTLRIDALHSKVETLTWSYRWRWVTAHCRYWWLRVRGVFDGS